MPHELSTPLRERDPCISDCAISVAFVLDRRGLQGSLRISHGVVSGKAPIVTRTLRTECKPAHNRYDGARTSAS